MKTYRETKYYGIFIDYEDGNYWISDGLGNDQFFGTAEPTEKDIDEYRERII